MVGMRFKRLKEWRHIFLVASFLVAGIGFVIAGGAILIIALTPTPDIASFANRQVVQSTKIYDRTGQTLLYDYNRDAKRTLISLADISPNAIQATIATEDSNFYQHGGIRITAIIRAAIADFFGGSFSQGGSTITQQVVKNTLLTSRKSIVRKVHEWVLAIRLEEAYSKDAILETYMNSIPYGGVLYGIGAASEAYFGVPAKDLSLAEAAYLAAMIRAPSYYSPYGAHRADLDTRKDFVLDRMKTLGFISDEAYASAKAEKVSFAPTGAAGIIAPHFVFYILNQLEEIYGTNALQSGLKVTTTLDADLQVKSEEIVRRYALKNAAGGGAKNGALLATDPSTGQILAMVGSRDFFDTAIDGQYNATLALRQPGSTMKPFVYALALERGYTRNTVVFDVPTQFSTACDPSAVSNNTYPCYAPINFDNTFRGPMTFESALAQSINIAAIKVLYLVGVQNAIDLAHSFGLTTLGSAKQCGLTMVIGGCEVRLLDLVNAYATFGNDGVKQVPTGILEVGDAQGNVLATYEAQPSRVIPPAIARDISAMLSDDPARVPEYRPNGVLTIPGYEVAVKTGTTDNSRDAWTVGYTPSIALGVWVGNNDNAPAKSLAGLVAAPMWHEAMAYALTKYSKGYFGEPSSIPDSVPPMLRGVWQIPDASGSLTPHSLLYWTDKKNPRGSPPGSPGNDPQFAAWEYGVQAFYASHPGLFYNPPIFVPLSRSAAPPVEAASPDTSTTE
jgi:penicillin-binding protein 1C